MYLKCDVLLLLDVFEKSRKRCLENYALCPSHYLRTVASSWDAMINITQVKLENVFPDGGILSTNFSNFNVIFRLHLEKVVFKLKCLQS